MSGENVISGEKARTMGQLVTAGVYVAGFFSGAGTLLLLGNTATGMIALVLGSCIIIGAGLAVSKK